MAYTVLKILNPTINFQAGNIKSIPLIQQNKVKIEKKGIQQGIKQGIQQGSQNILIELVKDNIISISEAAKRANMNVDEFSKLLK